MSTRVDDGPRTASTSRRVPRGRSHEHAAETLQRRPGQQRRRL
jgi:hypothetical protein